MTQPVLAPASALSTIREGMLEACIRVLSTVEPVLVPARLTCKLQDLPARTVLQWGRTIQQVFASKLAHLCGDGVR